ncbi:alpha-amylase [Breznakiella homolactica]|uniref:Alpha-amylase n=2 Tax=Breznakiella homolactica TaxID=2798577 RepID=A0A7T7XRX5_9SPIR|nr:alpha-amylase [Breznakiella homolactica]
MEFHIARDIRDTYGLESALFSLQGNVVLADFRQVRELAQKLNEKINPEIHPERIIKAGQLNAMGLIDEILHYVAALYREQVQPDAFETALARFEKNLGKEKTAKLFRAFCTQFPPREVYTGKLSVDEYLAVKSGDETNRALALEELMLLALANLNTAFDPFKFLFDDTDLAEKTAYTKAIGELQAHFAELPPFGPDSQSLWDLLRAPALASPDSLSGQLDFIRKKWGLIIQRYLARLLTGMDVIKEEEKPVFFGPGPTQAYAYEGLEHEYERFSQDRDWMPRTVLMAKSTLVWLFQLSRKYKKEITRLDQIPDEELDELARRGFTGLWLIGLWERSSASKTIKQWTGNPEAAASAYSLFDYDIAAELGGWGALTNLRERCAWRGIRLASDMVPNHTGIDSRWVMEHPDRFLQLPYPPFPTYTYNGGNLSNRDGVGVYIEDHYYNRTDAAVVFKRVDFNTGDTRYIYHGNDGTSMPWNDTAQIDFLNPEAREAVIRTIIGVCKQFSIVRFDAAMTLAKRHIQRLWYPEPGHGGDIASRAEHAISTEEFNRRMPEEFWREVVDRCAAEAPDTLLLAEAFWMLEGYFVRTLGMHRVYNSAFMNMLKNEENAKYRATIKNTLEFDPEILKRFVNFMNNPDEETAVAQFGRDDKYFGICTLLVTMPGLPMFGHGQIEGFEEKYGMEYQRSYRDEEPDQYMISRHEKEIFPLMKRRGLFAESIHFFLFDLFSADGSVNENIFAYTNRSGDDKALVLFNNCFYQATGWIQTSAVAVPQRDGGSRRPTLSEALGFSGGEQCFVVLWEQRSGLWYIRSSKELAEHGLFVSLNGYEAQVFLDIHEIDDTGNGRWARLHHELNGRGVENLNSAMQDIFLGELYAPFTALFSPGILETLYMNFASAGAGKASGPSGIVPVFTGSGPETGKESSWNSEWTGTADTETFIRDLKQQAMAFITTARKYLSGAGGRYEPYPCGENTCSPDPEHIWEDLSAFIRRFILISEYAAKAPAALGKKGKSFIGELAETVNAKPYRTAFVMGYGVLALLRPIIGPDTGGADAAALLDHWCLDRKLLEIFRGLGINGDESSRAVQAIKALLRRTRPAADWKDTDQPAELAVLAEAFEEDDLRELLGINLFDGVLWFNREAFDDALFFASLFLILESPEALEEMPPVRSTAKKETKKSAPRKKTEKADKPVSRDFDKQEWNTRITSLAKLSGRFKEAEENSRYRLDELLNYLSGDIS